MKPFFKGNKKIRFLNKLENWYIILSDKTRVTIGTQDKIMRCFMSVIVLL